MNVYISLGSEWLAKRNARIIAPGGGGVILEPFDRCRYFWLLKQGLRKGQSPKDYIGVLQPVLCFRGTEAPPSRVFCDGERSASHPMMLDRVGILLPLSDPFPLTGPLSEEKGVSLDAGSLSQILSKQKWKVLSKQTPAKWNIQGLDGQLPLLSCFPAEKLLVRLRSFRLEKSDLRKQSQTPRLHFLVS